MNNKKEYLSEENYQKTKKKITKASLIILLVGLVLGIGLILVGVVSQSNAKKTNEERYNEAKINVQKIGVADRINLYLGNAVEILPTLNFEYGL